MNYIVNEDFKFAKEITPEELNEAHGAICNSLKELRAKKGHDYGQCFEFSMADYGLLSPIIRFRDKLGRLENLLKTKTSLVTDESIRDTILDLGNYCILTCAVLDLIEKHKNMLNEDNKSDYVITPLTTTDSLTINTDTMDTYYDSLNRND